MDTYAFANWSISEEERLHYVAEIQGENTKFLIPIMTLLIFLSVLGIVGNTMVLAVYYKGFKKGATRVLILFIAAVDLFSCIFVIPGEVYDMFHLWDWSSVGLCRARMFITGTSTVASALALMVVAVVRFRKVCYPFGWQVGSRHARICAAFLLLFAMLASTPLATVNGRQTKPFPEWFKPDMRTYHSATFDPDAQNSTIHGIFGNLTEMFTDYHSVTVGSSSNMTTEATVGFAGSSHHNDSVGMYGHECTTDDAFKGTIWPVIATGILLLLFLGSAIPLCTVYGLIGHKAWKHRKKFQVQHLGNSKGNSSSDGVGLRVFRMLNSTRRKPSQFSSNGDTASSSNTNTTSVSGNSSSGGVREESSNAGISTISSGVVAHQNGKVNSSYVEDSESIKSKTAVGEGLDEAKTTGLSTAPDSGHSPASKNQRKISKQTRDESPNASGDKTSNLKETKFQTRKISQNPTEPISSTSDGQNFVDISLASNRNAQSEDSSNSEDCSDTNESRTRRFVKKARKISQTSMFKTLIKRSESDVTPPDQRAANSSWHSKFKRRSSKEKKERPEVINRTTVMLFTISSIYIVGYLSHLSMIFFKLGAPKTFDSLGFAGLALWNFFLRLYYVNCAANPVVYSLCDANFRKNCLTLFKKKK